MFRAAAVGAFALLAWPSAAQDAALSDTTRYLEVIDGRVLGQRLVWQEAPDTLGVAYTTNRYAWTRNERLVLDADGLPTFVEVTGEIRPGVPWRETFVRDGDAARWFTPVARGEATVEGPAYYAPVQPAHDLGVVARALLRRPSRTLPVLPGGEVRIEPLGQETVEANGETRTVRLHAVHGLRLFPSYVWLDADGATFAERWTILEGWEAAIPTLRAAIREAEMAHLRDLADALLPPARTRPFAIRGARLFDAAAGAVHDGTTVVVEGETITAVGPDGTVAVPAGAETIEAEGRMLLPGLWDMHAHHFASRSADWLVAAPLNLASGVTTARDVASDIEAMATLRAALDADEALGPHILPVGLVDGADGEPLGDVILAGTAEEMRAAVDRYADLGYVGVKSYNAIPADLVPVMIEHARERGLYVSGHPPNALTSGEAVEAGYDELHHVQMILAALPMSGDDAYAAGESWESWYQVMGELTPDSESVRTFIEQLLAHGAAVDVTLLVFISEGIPQDWIAADVHRMPPPVARALGHTHWGYAPITPLARPGWERTKANMLALVPVLHEAGVPLTIGTDTWPGFGLFAEMALMVEAGLSPADVLSLATLGAARAMGLDDEVGTIAPGQRADLLLVDGDPTVDIDDVRRAVAVVKAGRVVDPAAIYRALGIAPCCGDDGASVPPER